MFGGDLPVMHQSRKRKRKTKGQLFGQYFRGCNENQLFMGVRTTENRKRLAAAGEKTVHFMSDVYLKR
ncbi:hypothetical protein SAMN03159358_4504 [Paenibacillus sp. NFR01]|nr:hypothetical protein SAMN03159358_4504 [Paenibacillus sp. NFR01]